MRQVFGAGRLVGPDTVLTEIAPSRKVAASRKRRRGTHAASDRKAPGLTLFNSSCARGGMGVLLRQKALCGNGLAYRPEMDCCRLIDAGAKLRES